MDGANGTGDGDYGKERSAAALVMETAMAIEDEGFDFSQFDNGKGFIDVVILIVAGKGGNQNGNYFWPHMFVVPTSGYGLEDIDPGDWDQTIRVNLNGRFYCLKEAIPLFAVVASSPSIVILPLPLVMSIPSPAVKVAAAKSLFPP